MLIGPRIAQRGPPREIESTELVQNGQAIRSCSLPVSAVRGAAFTTIEGLSPDGTHSVQLA